ncbi:MAG TPA: hypothetical protein VF557_16720 [Jatrophihabitans sp.]|jgi:hypothetical protein|uniref:hypothetical protein n=1 Tax=Jatrophihabitans sp. TaxID=1932789 RepID=UPI002EE8EB8F
MASRALQELDELVDERLSRWDIRRQQDGDRVTYDVSSPDGRRVELGQNHSVHLWLSLPQGWRSDTAGDDVESLVHDFNEYISMADAILRGQLVVPPREPGSRRQRWVVPEFDLFMR